jgi:hypothetical protein
MKTHRKKYAKNILDFVQPDKPDGEDFFVFSLFREDPKTPTWYQAHTTFGTWSDSRETINSLVKAWMAAKPKGGMTISIKMYQGQAGRDHLLECFKDEMRYQQERKTQPNN